MKKLLVGFILFLCVIINTNAQSPIEKGAIWVVGSASFSSSSGDLYENAQGDSYKLLTLTPKVSYFVSNHLFISGTISAVYQLQGTNDLTTLGIGPEVGFAFSTLNNTICPYFALGYLYQSRGSTWTGSNVTLGLGMNVKVGENVGIIVGLNYNSEAMKYKHASVELKGNTLNLGVGISGIFY